MKQLIITLVGPDRPGLVEQISDRVLAHGGNWLASNLSHLAGHFAGIIQVELDEAELPALQTTLQSIPNLMVTLVSGETCQQEKSRQLNLAITANDRPGIVQELSTVLKYKGSNIVHFSSRQQSAPNWGAPIFNAIATVQLANGVDKDQVVKALEALTADIIVDVDSDE